MEDCPASGVCAGLPHWSVQAFAYYCTHRQQWFASVRVYECASLEEGPQRTMEFGPFDQSAEVANWLGDRITEGLNYCFDRNDELVY